MCIRTVSGEDILEFSLRTVPGEDLFIDRTVSGDVTSSVQLLGTKPTTTIINGSATGSYTPPVGCIYFEMYLLGGSGGGAGGGSLVENRYGGGGGGGNTAYGIFSPATYTYSIGGTRAGASAGGITGTIGRSASFDTIIAGRGLGGQFALTHSNVFEGQGSEASTNSLLQFGYCTAQPCGASPGQGGMSLFFGNSSLAEYNVAAPSIGFDGIFGGGGGATGFLEGGDGAAGKLLIIEYY
jgi:hypothetical protein